MQLTCEVVGDWKHAIKMSAQVGLQRISSSAGQGARGLQSALTTQTVGGSTINVEEMKRGGMVADAADGSRLEVLHDQRPHPNQMELLNFMVRDISWGIGLSPEVLWDLAKQTGPSQRYLMAETQRWIKHEQDRLRDACQRFWTYFVAKEIKNGNLPNPPANWWWAEWIPQADMTIDRGREGNLDLSMFEAGLMTLNTLKSKAGIDWEADAEQRAREIVRLMEIEQENNLPPGTLTKLQPPQNNE